MNVLRELKKIKDNPQVTRKSIKKLKDQGITRQLKKELKENISAIKTTNQELITKLEPIIKKYLINRDKTDGTEEATAQGVYEQLFKILKDNRVQGNQSIELFNKLIEQVNDGSISLEDDNRFGLLLSALINNYPSTRNRFVRLLNRLRRSIRKQVFELEGDNAMKIDYLGYRLSNSVIKVEGEFKGNNLAEQMTGGVIKASKAISSLIARSMNGGKLEIKELSSDSVGHEMNGGEVTSEKIMSGEVGKLMKRGRIKTKELIADSVGQQLMEGIKNVKLKPDLLAKIEAEEISAVFVGREMNGGIIDADTIIYKDDSEGLTLGFGMKGGKISAGVIRTHPEDDPKGFVGRGMEGGLIEADDIISNVGFQMIGGKIKVNAIINGITGNQMINGQIKADTIIGSEAGAQMINGVITARMFNVEKISEGMEGGVIYYTIIYCKELCVNMKGGLVTYRSGEKGQIISEEKSLTNAKSGRITAVRIQLMDMDQQFITSTTGRGLEISTDSLQDKNDDEIISRTEQFKAILKVRGKLKSLDKK